MKRFYITAILALICTIASYAQTIFDRYADTEGVTTVYISKAMLSMMPDMKTNGVNIGPIASKLDNIRILTCENKKLLPLHFFDGFLCLNPRNHDLMATAQAFELKIHPYPERLPLLTAAGMGFF